MGWFSDVTGDIGSGLKTVLSVPKGIMGDLGFGGGDGSNPFSGILKSLTGMFSGLTMSMILPFLIPIIGIILLFKLI